MALILSSGNYKKLKRLIEQGYFIDVEKKGENKMKAEFKQGVLMKASKVKDDRLSFIDSSDLKREIDKRISPDKIRPFKGGSVLYEGDKKASVDGKCCERCVHRYGDKTDYCDKHKNDDNCFRFKLER